jgi:hypothetical protein
MTYIATNETIAAAKAKTKAYLNSLIAVDRADDEELETIQPDQMQVGDHMVQHGCVYQIEEIKIIPREETSYMVASDIPSYIALGTYVSGDLSMYKWFLASAENGCAKDHRTSQQGNARATWVRVTK